MSPSGPKGTWRTVLVVTVLTVLVTFPPLSQGLLGLGLADKHRMASSELTVSDSSKPKEEPTGTHRMSSQCLLPTRASSLLYPRNLQCTNDQKAVSVLLTDFCGHTHAPAIKVSQAPMQDRNIQLPRCTVYPEHQNIFVPSGLYNLGAWRRHGLSLLQTRGQHSLMEILNVISRTRDNTFRL